MRRERLLDHLDDATRAELSAAGTPLAVPEGGFVVHDGDPADATYLVVDGLLKIVKTSLEGRVSFIGLRRSGTLVGEIAVLADSSRSSSLQAVEATRLTRIGRDRFESLLSARPDLSRAVLGLLATRLNEATDQIHDLMSADATTRMAARLAQLADETLDHPDEGARLHLPVSQQELGEWAGLSRAGAVKALRALRDRRLIETARMSMVITDLPNLRAAAAI